MELKCTIWDEMIKKEISNEQYFMREVSNAYVKYNHIYIRTNIKECLDTIRTVLDEFRDEKEYDKIWHNNKEDIIIAMEIMEENPNYNIESLYNAMYDEYKKGKENE